MIRQAQESDLDAILDLIDSFEGESLEEYGVSHSGDATDLMKKYLPYTLIAEKGKKIVGVISGMMTHSPLDESDILYQEFVWYVDPKERGVGIRLYKILERMLKEQGVKGIIMACMYNSNHEKLLRFYERLGYKPMETQLIKRF